MKLIPPRGMNSENRTLDSPTMDQNLARLIAFPGSQDLTVQDVADILEVSLDSITRAVNHPDPRLCLEAKRPPGRGHGGKRRIHISRTAVVLYLVKISTGDRQGILAAIAMQCSRYLPAALALAKRLEADATPGSQASPATAGRQHRKLRHHTDPYAGHPDLFQVQYSSLSE
jgi:hypothetical protein